MAKVSCNFEGFFENILLQDAVIEQNLYLITRYSYFKRKVSCYKILLLISVSRYYLQDTKIRYCLSLVISIYFFQLLSPENVDFRLEKVDFRRGKVDLCRGKVSSCAVGKYVFVPWKSIHLCREICAVENLRTFNHNEVEVDDHNQKLKITMEICL